MARSTSPAAGVLTGEDPRFRTSRGIPFIPSGAPLVGAGVSLPWMEGATDLAGNRRVIGRRPDLGAFEAAPAATTVLVR